MTRTRLTTKHRDYSDVSSYRAIFQAHLQRVSVQGERSTKKEVKIHRYKRNVTLQRWNARRVKSQTFLSGYARAPARRLRSRNVDRSKLYTITNPTRNYHVTSLAHCASGNVKD